MTKLLDPTAQIDYFYLMNYAKLQLRFVLENSTNDTLLEKRYSDIMKALETTYRESENNIEISMLFVNSVNTFARFLGFSGRLKSRVELGKRGLEIADKINYKEAIAELCCSTIPWALLQQGNYGEAKTFCLKGLDIALATDAIKLAGEATRSLCGIARDNMNYAESKEWAEKALEYGSRCNNQGLIRGAKMDLAYTGFIKHDYISAEKILRDLLDIYIAEKDLEKIANFNAGLGIAILNQKRIKEAKKLFDKAFNLGKLLDSQIIMGEAEFGLAKAAEMEHKVNLSEKLKRQAINKFRLADIKRLGRAYQFSSD